MNRIEHLRTQVLPKKITYQALADACDPPTTAQQIRRLEIGERRLTVGWMQILADAFTKLGVPALPVDLIDNHDKKEKSIDYHFRQLERIIEDEFVSDMLKTLHQKIGKENETNTD